MREDAFLFIGLIMIKGAQRKENLDGQRIKSVVEGKESVR